MTFGTCRYCGQVVNLDYEEETQAEAELPLTIWRLISSGARSTQNIFRSKNSVLKNIQRSSGYSYDRRKEGTSW